MIVSRFIWSLLKYVLAEDLRGGKIVKYNKPILGMTKGSRSFVKLGLETETYSIGDRAAEMPCCSDLYGVE